MEFEFKNGSLGDTLHDLDVFITNEEIREALEQARQESKDEHDTWGIGKQYKAPKKEWQPDVMDVDLTKKIWEW
tara:strand:+ start:164 stop:385 length:222 start_codon:yes stop_codon:yes gene_type:complete